MLFCVRVLGSLPDLAGESDRTGGLSEVEWYFSKSEQGLYLVMKKLEGGREARGRGQKRNARAPFQAAEDTRHPRVNVISRPNETRGRQTTTKQPNPFSLLLTCHLFFPPPPAVTPTHTHTHRHECVVCTNTRVETHPPLRQTAMKPDQRSMLMGRVICLLRDISLSNIYISPFQCFSSQTIVYLECFIEAEGSEAVECCAL